MNPEPEARSAPRPAPVERGRALGVLAGLLAFTGGFAVAGVLVSAGLGSTPPYLVAVTAGLVGIGVIGFFYHRGAVQFPRARIWSPVLLRVVISALGLPVVPVIAALYALAATGVVGNLLLPALTR